MSRCAKLERALRRARPYVFAALVEYEQGFALYPNDDAEWLRAKIEALREVLEEIDEALGAGTITGQN